MKTAPWVQQAGRLWGRAVPRYGLRYLDRRCARFSLTVEGAEHLRAAAARPCLVVANHVIIRPEDAAMGRLTQARLLSLFNQPADSFIFRRIVAEETGLHLGVVAKSDRGWWSPRPWAYRLQKHIGQPFGKGMLEGLGYVPVEHNADCFHRTFFQAAANALARRQPLLIYPGRIVADECGSRDSLLEGGILPGAAHLARKFEMTVLPAYIEGGSSWRSGQPATVTFGLAFEAAGMTKAQISREIIARVGALAAPAAAPVPTAHIGDALFPVY